MKISVKVYEELKTVFLVKEGGGNVQWDKSLVKHGISAPKPDDLKFEWIDNNGVNTPYLVTEVNKDVSL